MFILKNRKSVHIFPKLIFNESKNKEKVECFLAITGTYLTSCHAMKKLILGK